MTRVVLGVCGGIAAYKAVELLRNLTESGLDVTVVPTDSALRFVGEPTWAALSGKPVATDVWTGAHTVPHVALGQQADLVVVAPTTADFLARATHGVASDLLTNVLLTATCPVVLAPAMHTEMWLHPATQANVRTLRERGIIVLDPAHGRLTGADSGPGRLPDPVALAGFARAVVHRRFRSFAAEGVDSFADMKGKRVVISAGGTRESWDAVRYLGNRSSGRQGVALATAALVRGAQVTLIAGAMDVAPPAGARVVPVESAEDMRQAMHHAVADEHPDVVVMAAAVADFRPADVLEGKITKESLVTTATGGAPDVALERTTDILAELVARRADASTPLIVGFAAETPDPEETLAQRAIAKLRRKGCDLLVANDVSKGAVFGSDSTSIVVVGPSGVCAEAVDVSKDDAAHLVWDHVSAAPEPASAPKGPPSAG